MWCYNISTYSVFGEEAIDPEEEFGEERWGKAAAWRMFIKKCCSQDPAVAFVRDIDPCFYIFKNLIKCKNCVNK